MSLSEKRSRFRVFQNWVLVQNFETNKEEFIAGGNSHVYKVKLCNMFYDRSIITVINERG